MRIDSLCNLPEYPLPAPFTIQRFQPNDEILWADIEKRAGEFATNDQALAHHRSEFGDKEADLRDRQLFLVNSDGEPIGTATAWFNSDFHGQDFGRLHWVGIVPEWQGRQLAKPLVAAAMGILARHHERAYLTTQTRSYKAVKIYLDLGFRPYVTDEQERSGWALLSEVLGRPDLAV